jgi:hypothetical protein
MTMEETLREHLLTLARDYAGYTGLSLSTIGAKAADSSRFFDRIESGGSFDVRTYDRALRFFRKEWPHAIKWPRLTMPDRVARRPRKETDIDPESRGEGEEPAA